MIVKRPEIERALDSGGQGRRLFLLYGPDEAGSRSLGKRLLKALGPDAERIDISSATLKADPAKLADEAGASSLFGGASCIWVEPAVDDIIGSVQSVIDMPQDGNPVILIAGALRKDSKLVKLATSEATMLAFASYVPEGADADRIAASLARDAGLVIEPDVAHRLAVGANGDRAILASEVEKLALFVDAAPDRPRPVDHQMLDDIGNSAEESSLGQLVDAVLEGRLPAVEQSLARLGANGIEGIPILRALLRRLHQLAGYAAQVAEGNSIHSVLGSAGKALFWKDKDAVSRQLNRWRPAQLATAITRVNQAERALKASGSAGTILANEEIFAIARAARRFK